MYLKNLEVHGFKSFANKIVFDFHNGITGIVGPNGSGKSNVGDAVRWVLGEQSAKQLRGSNMQDVIFSGTENRKPLGFAYVAITLDNSDHQLPVEYDEVTVARRVYRSGESEYLLNNTVCRLKDVQELFYDTGIGKEGYSLIGQGQIDKILSGKPEERRELFDEAAGIVKFKKRKKTAQKNLENERANLVRINDILSELEKQVGPLERQSQTARTYLQKKEELKKNDISLFVSEVSRIKGQEETVEENLRIAEAQLEETRNKAENVRQEYVRVDEETGAVSEKLEHDREMLSQNLLTCERLEGEINVLKEQMLAQDTIAAQFDERMKLLEAQAEEKKASLAQRMSERDALTQELKAIQGAGEKAEEQLAQWKAQEEALQAEIERTNGEIIRLINEKGEAASKQERYDAIREQSQIRRAELNQKLLQIKSNEARQDVQIKQYEEVLQEVCARIQTLTESVQSLESSLKEVSARRREINERLAALQEQYHQNKSRLDNLVNMTERYDGYGNAIRRVMEQKDKNPGIVGVVADIVKTEKKYETAIETALGGSIQNIVTDTEDTAKRMIEYLKANRLGRATFLPLTGIQSRGAGFGKDVTSQKGVIGVASQIVNVQSAFLGLAEYLLGKTLVVDVMDNAIAIARKNRHSIRIVTLDGELLSPGGSMTGGAFRNTSNLLGRRREIEELREKVQKEVSETSHLRTELEGQNQRRRELEESLAEQKQKLQEEFINQNTAKLNLDSANSQKQSLVGDAAELKGESQEIESQLQMIASQTKAIHDETEGIAEKLAQLEQLVDQRQADIAVLAEQEEKLQEEISQGQVHLASENQKLTNAMEYVASIQNELRSLKQQEAFLRSQYEDALRENGEKELEIDDRTSSLQQYKEANKTLEQEIAALNERRNALQEENRSFFDKREELSRLENELDKEAYRLTAQKEKLEERFETLMSYMWEEYELTYHAALEGSEQVEESQVPALKKEILRLKNEIKALGHVNVNAIEEYKEISQRYEFMKGQHDDLLASEKTLLDVIAELDEGMRTQFNEKFGEIRVEFDKAYKELFGGGKGTIELDDETDVLEAGITINSQPPGKKLGNMMQLSGGEKALTAIALLFAIQNLKPSPFCLLDEIEAALDDSNVDRYARYLNKLTKNTQFIIITHRRGTMAAADRLYGITMQEKGVSTLVSVNLIEDDLEA